MLYHGTGSLLGPPRKADLADMLQAHHTVVSPGPINEPSLQDPRTDINHCGSQGSRFLNFYKDFLIVMTVSSPSLEVFTERVEDHLMAMFQRALGNILIPFNSGTFKNSIHTPHTFFSYFGCTPTNQFVIV